MRIINRPLVFLLALSMFLTIMPIPYLAADQPPVTLQRAIEIAKQKFTVPAAFTEFTSRYSDYNQRPTWSLNWTGGEEGGLFSVDIDSRTGEVVAMSFYQREERLRPAVRIPNLTMREAATVSEQFLHEVVPQRMAELRLVPPEKASENLINAMTDYSIYWQRFSGNIPVQGEGAVVRVNKLKGNVVSYQLNWNINSLPQSHAAVSPAQAKQAFLDAGMLELQYLVAPPFRPLGPDEDLKPVLAYCLTHKSRGLIDALTGKPLVIPPGNYLIGLEDYSGYGGYMSKMKRASLPETATVALTPEEQEEIRKSSNLLTQQAAVELLSKWVPVVKTMALRNASLESEYGRPQIRIWNLNFVKVEADGSNSMLYARMDAATGELASFSYDFPRGSFDPQKSISREQAEQAARDFIQRLQPEKFRNVKASPDNEIPYYQSSQPPTRYFEYTRLVNNIPVQNQGMTVIVDGITGDIISYNLNWPELNFPSPAGIMSRSQAYETFLARQPLTLSYCAWSTPQDTRETKMVYLPWSDQGSSRSMAIDARTGDLLDWTGQPLPQPVTGSPFKDLVGSPAQREINILGQLGLFREYGSEFRPLQAVTLVSFLRALILAQDGDISIYKNDDADILDKARDRGWLSENLAPTAILNRETAGRILIRYLNLEHIASRSDLYINPYQDIKKGSNFVGYAAILKSYQVMEGKGSIFAPAAAVSRAEAAQYIYRLSKVNVY